MHTQRVDATEYTAVAVCTCGWRDIAATRIEAREMIHTHVLACHPGGAAPALSALIKLRKRAAG